MKVTELEGGQLAYWVAKAQGFDYFYNPMVRIVGNKPVLYLDGHMHSVDYRPHQDAAQAFELIEKFKLTVEPSNMDAWWAYYLKGNELEAQRGPTLEVAICRAVVASVYGDGVSDE